MRRFYFNIENMKENKIFIVEEEFSHLKNVLRLKQAEKVVCFCGNGKDYVCQIEEIKNNKAALSILEILEADTVAKTDVSVFQGSLKLDKFELVIQKLAELGIKKITPFESAFSVAKLKPEKIERYKKISISASKQCKRADFMQIENKLTFKEMLNQLKNYDKVVFAYESEDKKTLKQINLENFKNKKIAIIVGSEGGFNKNEVEALQKLEKLDTISLGKRILRAETASITLSALVMFMLDEI